MNAPDVHESLLAGPDAPLASTPEDRDQVVVLYRIPWAQYDGLCVARENTAGPRMAYLDGALEIMSPSPRHEYEKKLIARLMAEGVRDIFSLLHATIRKHGQQQQTVRLRNAWINVDPRGWKTRDDMTINVGLGAGGKAQQFAQTMAIANVQKELLSGGKTNLVGDVQLYNTAAELTRIMGHKNPDQFFNDPAAINPQTGQLLHPPPAPPTPPPDPKLLAAQARAQTDQMMAAHKAQIEQQQAQNAAIHLQVKAQTEAELAKLKADLDARLSVLDAHLKAASGAGKPPRTYPPGARKARDGHHYVSDPNRPGKYLLVVHHG